MANASVRQKKTVNRLNSEPTVKMVDTASKFRMLKNSLKYIQMTIGFYAFCNILFWLAYSAKIVSQTSGLYVIFQPAWSVVNMFYTYKSVQGKEEVDFTGVVCALCLVLIAVVLRSVCEYVAELEENAKIEDQKRYEKAQKRAMAKVNGNLKTKNAATGRETGFVFLLDVDIKQVSGFIQGASVSPEEIAKIKTNFFKSLLNNLNLNQVTQKGYYKKKLFLVYKNISYFDDFIFYTRETLMSLSKEFVRPTLRIDFLVNINSIGISEDFKDKLDVLDTINKLALRNEFICTQSLKNIYETLPKQQYSFTSKGVYNLSKNLNVSNHQEIFSLREGR